MRDRIVLTESMIVIMFICVLIINGLWQEKQDGVLDQLTHQTGVAATERSDLKRRLKDMLEYGDCHKCHIEKHRQVPDYFIEVEVGE